MKRIIYVLEQHRKDLERAAKWAATVFAAGAIGESGKDTYKYIKDHLKENGIPHNEVIAHPSQIPNGHAYYHD